MLEIEPVIDLMATLAEEEKLQVAVTNSLLGGLVAGTATVLGGLLMGPVGLAVGGTVGGTVSYLRSRNKFISVAEILINMDPKLKERLYQDSINIFEKFAIEDVKTLHTLVYGDALLRQQLVMRITNHVHGNLKLELREGLSE